MIKFHSLELNNFFSHVSTSLNFEDYKGLVLIEGQNTSGFYTSNGSGKSTILEGIVYALTGDTLRGVSVNDVINRNYRKDTRVSLSFSRNDINYEVSRYRKDTKYGDTLMLHKSGEDISKRVNKETQKSLDNILNISYKLLISTILLGEGLSARFTQLSDSEKKSLIESTLNLNYDINKLRDTANTELKSLRMQQAKLEGEIDTLISLQDTDISLLENIIIDNKSCINIYSETIDQLKKYLGQLTKEVDSINPKIQLINETLVKVNQLSGSYVELMRANAHYQEERDRVLNSEVPVCAMCRQRLSSVESIQSVIDNYNLSIQDNLAQMEIIDNSLSQLPAKEILEKKLEALSSEYTEKSQKIRDMMHDITEYEVKIAESQNTISNAQSALSDSKDCSQQISMKSQEKKSIEDAIKKYEYFYNLFSPTGIINHILSDAISYINTRIATYSEILLEKDYHIQFIKGKISLVDSKGASYQSLSNGEKRRLDIAIQFSLHDYVHMYCGDSVDTIFLDEVLDTLDDVGIENIITVLRLKLEYCHLSRIFVISHNSELKSYFDNVVTVVKDSKGDSRLLNS